MISGAFRIMTPMNNQLTFDFIKDTPHKHVNNELLQVFYIKNNLDKTNNQIADVLDISVHRVRNLQRKYNCCRTAKEVFELKSRLGKEQTGPANNNWKNGRSKIHSYYKRKQIEKYPERVKARMIAYTALRNGKITKQPCIICGDDNSQMHHEDYSKPLQTIPLCKKHHLVADKFLKEGIKFEEIKHELRNKKVI